MVKRKKKASSTSTKQTSGPKRKKIVLINSAGNLSDPTTCQQSELNTAIKYACNKSETFRNAVLKNAIDICKKTYKKISKQK